MPGTRFHAKRTALRVAAIVAAVAAGYLLHGLLEHLEFVTPSNGRATVVTADATGEPRTSVGAGGVAAGTVRNTGFGPALGNPDGGRMPGEFERIDALMIGVNELIEHHPETLVQIVAALAGGTEIVALISKPDQERRTLELLRAHDVATDRIRFFLWPAEGMWVQDFGPQEVVGDEVRVVDFEYAPPGREADNQLPMAFAATFGMKIAHCHLQMEGGSILSNGRGLCVSTTTLIDQNVDRGHDLEDVGRILRNDFGFTRWIYLRPLVGESTGHLDMFLTLCDPATVMLASYDPAEDADNAALTDENARILEAQTDLDGRPLKVIRIRQPAAKDGCWRSYTNVMYGRGI